MYNPLHTFHIWINPQTLEHSYTDIKGPIEGMSKALAFLESRRGICQELGILETDVQEERDMLSTVLCSNLINKCVAEWENDILKTMKEKWTLEELYEPSKGPKPLINITPKTLLDNLTKLNEKERNNGCKWRGKMSPEGIVKNLHARNSKDIEMVTEMITHIIEEEFQFYKAVGYKKEPNPEVLHELVDYWKTLREPKSFKFATSGHPMLPILSGMLGVKMKRKHWDSEENKVKQSEYKKSLCYTMMIHLI